MAHLTLNISTFTLKTSTKYLEICCLQETTKIIIRLKILKRESIAGLTILITDKINKVYY